MELKGIIFDMDGVLTETSEHHYQAWKLLAMELGIDFNREKNEALKGVSRRESLLKILGEKQGEYSETHIQQMMKDKNDKYLQLIEGIDSKDLNPGILNFLNEIKKKGYKIAVASASHSARFLVHRLGISSYIDYIADPSTCRSKPWPDLFLAAANGLDLSADACIAIEDAGAGVEAIHKASMMAVGIGVDADLSYASTSELCLEEIENAYDNYQSSFKVL